MARGLTPFAGKLGALLPLRGSRGGGRPPPSGWRWGARGPRVQRQGLRGRGAVGAGDGGPGDPGVGSPRSRARRSYLPTKFSSTELLPALWPPTTAICGRSRSAFWPMAEKASCNRLTSGMRSSMPRLPMAAAGPAGCDPAAAPAPGSGLRLRRCSRALRLPAPRAPRPSGIGAESLTRLPPEGARAAAGQPPCAGAVSGTMGIVVFPFCGFWGA